MNFAIVAQCVKGPFFVLKESGVATISDSNELIDGAIYKLKLQYGDAIGNPVASTEVTNLHFAGNVTKPPKMSAVKGKFIDLAAYSMLADISSSVQIHSWDTCEQKGTFALVFM